MRCSMIVDGDGHYVELPMQWVEYLPSKLRDRVYVEYTTDGDPNTLVTDDVAVNIGVQPVGVQNVDGPDRPSMIGTLYGSSIRRGFGDSVTPGGLKRGRPQGLHIGLGDPGGWSGKKRLEVHDREGI